MPSYVQLVEEATRIIKGSYPDSILFVATGSPDSGVAKKEDDLKKWLFRATGPPDNNTVVLKYKDGKWGDPEISTPWLGVKRLQLPQGTIGLTQAIGILNKHNFYEFVSVSMGTPVVPDAQPMYWFCVDYQTQGVSASTGDFFPDLFPCGPEGVQIPE